MTDQDLASPGQSPQPDGGLERELAGLVDPRQPVQPTIAVLEAQQAAAAQAVVDARLVCDRASRESDPAAGPLAEVRLGAAQDRYEAASDRLAAARFLHRSRRDGLTGVLQRQAGEGLLQQEVERAQREQRDLVVAFVDVDGLKRINDQRGHAAGDEALRSVGQALTSSLRSDDVVVRYGGDEFVCALPGASLDDARARFAQVRSVLQEVGRGTTVTVGLWQVLADDTAETALQRADADLYLHRSGRPHAAAEHRGTGTGWP